MGENGTLKTSETSSGFSPDASPGEEKTQEWVGIDYENDERVAISESPFPPFCVEDPLGSMELVDAEYERANGRRFLGWLFAETEARGFNI